MRQLRRLHIWGAISVVALLLAVAASSATAVTLKRCTAPNPNAGQGPRDDRFVPFGHVKVAGESCAAALQAIRNGRMRPRFHTRWYACKVIKQSHVGTIGQGGFITGQTISCKSGTKQFQWAWVT